MRKTILVLSLAVSSTTFAQDVTVEYDKDRDMTKYKTFAIGESEIITPKDQRTVPDDKLHEHVQQSLTTELTEKGLTKVDSLGDLIVSYIIGSMERRDVQNLGPMGISPTSSDQTWSREFREGSFVIDLNDRNNFLIWRVNAITSTGTPSVSDIDGIIDKGFRKFSLKPKKVKKKKS